MAQRYDDLSSRGELVGRTESTATRGTARASSGRESDTIQLKEERLRAEKQPVETGEVRVRKEVRTETQHIDVPVQREEVVIESNT